MSQNLSNPGEATTFPFEHVHWSKEGGRQGRCRKEFLPQERKPKYKNILNGLFQTVDARLLPAIYSNSNMPFNSASPPKMSQPCPQNTDSTRN